MLATDRKILPESYNPNDIFIRGLLDNKTILSAYAFLLGMYPHSVNEIEFMPQLKDAVEDVTPLQIRQVRNILGVGDKMCRPRKMEYYGGNADNEFITSPLDQYPGIRFNLLKNLNEAKIVFEREYANQLYDSLAKEMKVERNHIDFFTTIEFLEDYITAKYNMLDTAYEFSNETKLLIKVYYLHYFKLGLFSDPAYTRLLTHNYFR